MTSVFFNHDLILTTPWILPALKWSKIARKLNLRMENYTTAVLLFGDGKKKSELM